QQARSRSTIVIAPLPSTIPFARVSIQHNRDLFFADSKIAGRNALICLGKSCPKQLLAQRPGLEPNGSPCTNCRAARTASQPPAD
ncbi:hypothetical protein, partial [Mesorhizobium sp. M5C.F.Ca.IN.020.29.1.1]|uniref:hypothetical protein n=1 Tax=Mesorhizobium sp. M5C.F.Ca.IN.020.29.1.1 TaxID=2496770 RepID=UPI0019CFCD0C